jgi:hypothetical protein
MTPEEFYNLSIEEKVNLILTYGKELLDRVYMYYIIKLYLISGFYVEIWYHQTTRKIDRVKIIKLEDVLHLYESQINISDLYK